MTETAPHRRVTWLGHATTVIDLDGTKLLTDPVLRPRVMHLRRAWAPDPGALRGVDAVLVSHVHFDHLDLPSLERIGRKVPIVVPRGAGGLLRKRRFEQVLEVDVGEELRVGNVTVVPTEALHEADRGPLGTKAGSVGFLVRGHRSVYFAGDTDLFPGMVDLAPGLDLALVPISGWGATAGPGHLDPSRAAEALTLLRPRACVPIHWGTYSPLSWSATRRAVADLVCDEFLRAAAELAPEVEIRVLERNGVVSLD